MTKSVLLMLTFLCCSAWMLAQSTPQSGSSPESTNPSSQTGSATSGGQTGSDAQSSAMSGSETIQGCLMGSSGSYTLTDSSGNQYQLEGNTAKLATHVNKQVEIRGSEASAGSSATATGASAASGTGAAKMFKVRSVKKISDSCASK